MLIRRTYRLLAASIAFTFSHSALAIGVGEIVVNSYVNEPLSADIAILDPKDLSESEVIASLASLADFDRLDIERHYSLGALVFETDMKGAGSSVIRVTTADPIREPYLNFLVELKWPEGRVLREYTVFLDLRPRPQVQSVKNGVSQVSSRVSQKGLRRGEYRVAQNDTLGAIAARFRVEGVSIDQMMLAIKDANRGKFLRDNINGIRAGVLLEIPSTVDESLSPRDAAQRVVDQWDEWKRPAGSRGLRIVADNEIETYEDSKSENDVKSARISESASVSSVGVPPASSSVVSESITSESETAGVASTNLAAIEARLATLSDQLSEIQGVVASKDEEIASLKAELAKRPLASTTSSMPPLEKPTEQTEAESGLGGILWALLIAALGTIAYIARRRFSGAGEGGSGASIAATADEFENPLDDLLPVPSQKESMNQRSELEASKGYGESLLTGYVADQSLADAIAEAEIYVAYGRHQHALDTLEAASAAEPANAPGLLKMLEIYISLDRIEEAERLMTIIEQTGDRDAMSVAVATLSGVSDILEGDAAAKALATESEMVESDVVESGAVESAEPDEIDVSLDLEFQEAANAERVVPEESDTSGMLDNDEDPADTALDLARAYLDMGDKAGAKDLLETAISMGDEAQVEVAQQLLASIE
ncbi:FimV C-terminal domain/FimV N-terminal domain [gamma proteobacterium HIMB55]|nr:FimV C-terminal domain/FimV N-terminal domain [gamma proteobacterium HIMB55]